MTENVCLVCLKTFQSFPNNDPSLSPPPPQDEKCGAPLLTKFLKFAKNYLKVSSPVPTINKSSGETFPDAFCEKCELAVITPICQVYLEFLSTQLRLSWELEQLGKLLDSSQLNMSNQLRVIKMRKITEHLGVEDPCNLQEFRSLLSQKCQLKRKETLPDVLVQSRCTTYESIRPQMNSLSERSNDDGSDGNDDDDDEDFDPLDSRAVDSFEERSDEDEAEETKEVAENGKFKLKDTVTKIKVEAAQFLQDDHLIVPDNEDVEEEGDDHQYSNSALDSWHKCSKCERFFASLKGLIRHISICSGIKKQSTKKAKDLAGATVAFPCAVCDKLFPTGKSRDDHKYYAHTKKRYKCPKCKYVAKTRSVLRQHFIEVHNPQQVVCSQCPKTFKSRRYLLRHFRQAHPFPGQITPLISHGCPNPSCDRNFPTRSRLNRHLNKCSYKVSAPMKNEVNVSNIIKIEETF